ncbi:MAG TPA: radical SAM protein [Candidatus Limnocylindrales bacterium]|nr:radical SAM protein [Candidatus Limnocylindrales bacterium]
MLNLKFSPEEVWNSSCKELLRLLESGFLTPKPKKIHFYSPSFTYYKNSYYRSSPTSFPTISVTGTSCALNCKHCAGKVLETMQTAVTPEKLFELCSNLKRDGAVGCLVSGGCLPDGSVPLDGFMDALGRVKRDLGLTVFVHTGIVNFETAASLKKAGVDAALIDVIGSFETTKKVLNLDFVLQDFLDALKALEKSGLNFVPHVLVGLDEGKLKGEFDALKIIAEVKPAALVLIAFMPIHGTAMERTKPPTPESIAKVASVARLMFPETPLMLGCMRPKGASRPETDVLALKAGVDAIAFPSEEAVKFAESRGWKTSFSSCCCAQMYFDFAQKN